MILQTNDLWRKFGGVAAVAGVDFSLQEGELRCLIGANGAGKSTFFKMLTGQLRPTSGTINLFGQDITGASPHAIARMGVGVKTQVPNLFDELSAHENLYIAARRRLSEKSATQAADDMLEEIQLSMHAQTPAGRLAHGHRQWLELGVILVTQPKLVLLDEPAAGMTVGEVERTVALLNRLRGQRTFIIVEHDMHFIRRIAQKVTVFHRGQILVEDEVEVVLRDPKVREAYLGRRGGDAR